MLCPTSAKWQQINVQTSFKLHMRKHNILKYDKTQWFEHKKLLVWIDVNFKTILRAIFSYLSYS